MRQHDGGALLAESIIIDPGLSEAQRAGFQTGWQLAASTPTDELAESAINLVAEVMHGDRDGSTSSQLLGFLAYLQRLIQEISAACRGGRVESPAPSAPIPDGTLFSHRREKWRGVFDYQLEICDSLSL